MHIVLTIVLANKCLIHQLEVNNTFLNDTLEETVYYQQPFDFVNPELKTHVCHLNRLLYGLKQAPGA